MIILFYFDWFGTADELNQFDEMVKNVSQQIEGIEYKGRYTPNQKKFHWIWLIESEDFGKWEEAWNLLTKYPRDLRKLPHGIIEFFPGPYHQ